MPTWAVRASSQDSVAIIERLVTRFGADGIFDPTLSGSLGGKFRSFGVNYVFHSPRSVQPIIHKDALFVLEGIEEARRWRDYGKEATIEISRVEVAMGFVKYFATPPYAGAADNRRSEATVTSFGGRVRNIDSQ